MIEQRKGYQPKNNVRYQRNQLTTKTAHSLHRFEIFRAQAPRNNISIETARCLPPICGYLINILTTICKLFRIYTSPDVPIHIAV